MSLFASFFGTKQGETTENASAIDVVTYLASLASDPKAIDLYLDTLRKITANLAPGQALSVADQTVLVGVCQKLIAYLTENDPLRTLDKTTLQQKISQRFPRPNPAESVFWTKLRAISGKV